MAPVGSDAFLTLGLPAGCIVGIDGASLTTSAPSFPGFRDLVAGAHLVWAAADAESSTRSGYWIATPPRAAHSHGAVYVKQWHPRYEELGEPPDLDQEWRLRAELGRTYNDLTSAAELLEGSDRRDDDTNADAYLCRGPSLAALWCRMTEAIRPELLARMTGSTVGASTGWKVTTTDDVQGQEPDYPFPSGDGNRAALRSPLRFTFSMNERLISPTAVGEQRTQQALDPSDFVIEKLERLTTDGIAGVDTDLVGELSVAFLTGTHLGNMSAMEQWFYYLNDVVFRCYKLAAARSKLVCDLLGAVTAQLTYEERALGGDSVLDQFEARARVLQRRLATYKARLDGNGGGFGDPLARRAVLAAFAALETLLRARRGWDLGANYVRAGRYTLEDGEEVDLELSDFEAEDERGEFAPTVVDAGG
ncbi:A1 cistron-splicing factor [Hypoxylon sp. FL1150]|nr:A1 cistron-splicing factor [Hypoxylon sp. FL1150]